MKKEIEEVVETHKPEVSKVYISSEVTKINETEDSLPIFVEDAKYLDEEELQFYISHNKVPWF